MNANALLADKTITRSLTLARLSAHEEAEVLRQLARLERDLLRDLQRANLTRFRKDRHERLLRQTRNTIRGHYKTIRDTQGEQMERLTELEGTWTVRSLNGAISEPVGVYLDLASVSWTAQQVKAIAGNAVIDQSPSRTWWAKQAGDTQRRFSDQVKQGLLRGENNETIVRAVRESVMPLSRAQAEALVRSSISAVTHAARMATYKQNETLLSGYRQLSTLDSRTTIICIAYSNKMWTLDGVPIGGHNLPMLPFPRHWNERSVLQPLLKPWGELAGKTLPNTDGQTVDRIFRDKLRAQGWDEDRIAAARRRTQASMDGSVPVEMNFQQFMERKGAAFQDEALGKGKAELFRKGIVTNVSQLVSGTGNLLTLKQLRRELGVMI